MHVANHCARLCRFKLTSDYRVIRGSKVKNTGSAMVIVAGKRKMTITLREIALAAIEWKLSPYTVRLTFTSGLLVSPWPDQIRTRPSKLRAIKSTRQVTFCTSFSSRFLVNKSFETSECESRIVSRSPCYAK